jgi:hypothetical protein
MSTADHTCPLHPSDCNPQDAVHALGHQQARQNAKAFYFTVLRSPGADPTTRKAVEDYLDSIPFPPRPAKESNPRIPL